MKLQPIEFCNVSAQGGRASNLYQVRGGDPGFGYVVQRIRIRDHDSSTLTFPDNFDGLCAAVKAMREWQGGKDA